jgi:type IV secretory pathway VirB10-like protein
MMVIISAAVAFYSFSQNTKKNAPQSQTAAVPRNIYVTPGAESSEKYVELQEQANLIGTQQAAAKGQTFIPTIIGNKSDESTNTFNQQLSGILNEKLNSDEHERLSKILASLLEQLNSQGTEMENLLKLIRELQNQGFNVEDLEALLKKLQAKGYNTDELAKLLKMLQQQGYAVNDLENMLRRLLTEGYDPRLINKILDQLLQDRLKRLQDAIQQLKNAGFLTDELDALRAQLNNRDFDKLLQQLANQGYQLDSLDNLLKQLMNKGYNVFEMPIMIQQLQRDGYDVGELQKLLEQMQANGNEINDIRDLIKALAQQNIKQPVKQPDPTPAPLQVAKSSTQEYKDQLSNLFSSNQDDNQATDLNSAEAQYEAFLQKQREKELAEQRARELAEQERQEMQRMLLNSEAMQKDLENILNNMSTQANTIVNESSIPPQSFVQGTQERNNQKEQQSTSPKSNLPNNSPRGENSSGNAQPDKVLKAGTILFAILETAVNSDEPGPILARIVQPPLSNTTLIGNMQKSNNRYAEGLLLSFSKASIPNLNRSYGLSAVAIDPDTARTVIASDVNHHYLQRWGTLFAATFLKGYSKAIAESGTTVNTSTNGAQATSVTTKSPLNPKQQIFEGLGEVASAFGENIGSLTNRPITIKIHPGTSIGLLLTSDFTIPKADANAANKESATNPQLLANNPVNMASALANNSEKDKENEQLTTATPEVDNQNQSPQQSPEISKQIN